MEGKVKRRGSEGNGWKGASPPQYFGLEPTQAVGRADCASLRCAGRPLVVRVHV